MNRQSTPAPFHAAAKTLRTVFLGARRQNSAFSGKLENSKSQIDKSFMFPFCKLRYRSPLSNLVRSFMTSPAIISPTTDGTKAVEPGISRRWVHFLAVPGGQMQC